MSRIVSFIPNRNFWIALAVMFALCVFVAPTFAQDVLPTEQQPITPEEAANLLLNAVTAIVAGGLGGSLLSSFLVGLLKHVPLLDKVTAPTLNLTVGGILTVVWWIASHFGYQLQFKAISDFILAAGPALLALFTTMYGASKLHKVASAEKVPVFGYQRTPSTAA